ncbi:hypothetical protein ASPZODRAFT_125029 [Penicilliopsis zonata CBS 506.65]|uniref:Aromatic amino acid beta-eliminating lyase/threonine aldolase domain-containing protein n=1 Tax=Penicilliopsis zonata CBS 506.65 TaxID=1073090 RepID=A0A1L9S686_9EURO|nr:hypothetical protein ASPZODRAFT_125029 [Penicilliopsis zonata CBS 506.65]OJJ42678.1 hypothetical protein ASPZODRAFT_125029 [Penicilliopsis zonata CBS 506.65]
MPAILEEISTFRDDYSEGAHPAILAALLESNRTQERPYGADEHSNAARRLICARLGCSPSEAAIHFVPSGTAANRLCIAACLRPFEAVITLDAGHIVAKEAGAIENTGHKTILVPPERHTGKLVPAGIEKAVAQHSFHPHSPRPRLVYLSNASENGTVYSRSELHALSATCRRLNLLLMIDGARLGVALRSPAAQGLTLRDLFQLTDLFWIGGTKCGALLGEAIVVRNRVIADDFILHLKQHGALLAKGRVLGVQFEELFKDPTPSSSSSSSSSEDCLYFRLADHANEMARRIGSLFESRGYALAAPVQSNLLFVAVPRSLADRLGERFGVYVWEEREEDVVVRLVTSWATEKLQVDKLAAWLESIECVVD